MSVKATAVMPTEYMRYAQEAMVGSNDLIAQGVVEYDTRTINGQSGLFFTTPYQASLDTSGDVTQILADTTTVTPDAPSDFEVIVPKVMYSKGWTEAEFTNTFRGVSSYAQIGTQIAQYWGEQIQNKIVNNWKALFASGGALNDAYHVYSPGTSISAGNIAKATALFGEKMNNFDKMIMNSNVAADLTEKGLLTPYPTTQMANAYLQSGAIMNYLGKRVIINDTLCTPDEYGVYPTYIVAGSPYYVGIVKPLTEKIIETSDGGGTTQHFFTMAAGMGLKGVSYTNGTFPATDALLGTAGSFTRKWSYKNIPVIQLNCPLSV